jgi:hypothetical protein
MLSPSALAGAHAICHAYEGAGNMGKISGQGNERVINLGGLTLSKQFSGEVLISSRDNKKKGK